VFTVRLEIVSGLHGLNVTSSWPVGYVEVRLHSCPDVGRQILSALGFG